MNMKIDENTGHWADFRAARMFMLEVYHMTMFYLNALLRIEPKGMELGVNSFLSFHLCIISICVYIYIYVIIYITI